MDRKERIKVLKKEIPIRTEELKSLELELREIERQELEATPEFI